MVHCTVWRQAKLIALAESGNYTVIIPAVNLHANGNALFSFEADGLKQVTLPPEVMDRLQVFAASNIFEALWAVLRLADGKYSK